MHKLKRGDSWLFEIISRARQDISIKEMKNDFVFEAK